MKPALTRSPWGAASAAAGTAGLVALVPGLPTLLATPLVAVAVLLGPGALLLTRVDVPRGAALVLVPATGIAVVVLLSTAMSLTGLWLPQLLLAVLAGASAVGGAVQLRRQVRVQEPVR